MRFRFAAALAAVVACAFPLAAGEGDAAPPDDPAAQALLARFREKLLGRPLFASGRLVVRRGGRERDLTLKLHVRSADTTLARIQGSPRENGTTVLRSGGRIHVFFPRADLVAELPPSLGSDRLFGSDFALDDLLAPGGDPERFVAAFGPPEALGGAACVRIDLRPRTPRAALTGRTSVWIEETSLLPRRVEVFSDRGARLRVVETEGASSAGLPLRWRARTEGPRGGTSELEFRFLERDPPIDERFFTVEGLRSWR